MNAFEAVEECVGALTDFKKCGVVDCFFEIVFWGCGVHQLGPMVLLRTTIDETVSSLSSFHTHLFRTDSSLLYLVKQVKGGCVEHNICVRKFLF